MKITKNINKKVIVEEIKPLTEVDEIETDKAELEKVTETGQITVIDDINDASTEEIEDALDKAAPQNDEEHLDINELLAQDIKVAADGIDNLQLIAANSNRAQNKLSVILDRALRSNLDERYNAYLYGTEPEFFNVLVTGLPGSGKTAIIHSWAKSRTVNGHPIHLVEIDSKNDDLGAFINGFAMLDRTQPDKNIVTQGQSNNLDGLEKFASVLFLDEFNRQVKANIRGSLLSLINEHAVSGSADQKGKKRIFNNFLFTIAAINPAIPSDKGASPLNDAELSRFDFKVRLDSDVKEARNYFLDHFENAKERLAPLKKTNPDRYVEQLDTINRQMTLIDFLLSASDTDENGNEIPAFRFDTEDDLRDLAGNVSHQKTMLNQRMLTRALKISMGYKDLFLDHVNNSSEWLPKDVKIINEILDDYEDPEDSATIVADEEDATEQDELFGGNNIGNGKTIVTPADVDKIYDKNVANFMN